MQFVITFFMKIMKELLIFIRIIYKYQKIDTFVILLKQ
jgi:hypothetical protein